MWYYTDYALNIYRADKDKMGKVKLTSRIAPSLGDAIKDEIEKMNVFDSDGSIRHGYYAYDMWSDHERDMRLLSARFPDIAFCLAGRGDNNEDMWREYYVGGRMQWCPARIEFDDFDQEMLDADTVEDAAHMMYSRQD